MTRGALALAVAGTAAILIGLGLTGGFGYVAGGHTNAPAAAADQFAPPPEAPGPLSAGQPPNAGGCTSFARYGYTTREACIRMVSALASADDRVCAKRRWRTLFHFRSRAECRRFVADHAAGRIQ